MIPATHFLPLHDGTAWVVFGDDDNERDFFPAEWVTDLDRPCDTCDGTGAQNPDEDYDDINIAWAVDVDTGPLYDCTADCIDGRHTFDIEVPRHVAPMRDGIHIGTTVTLQVSIIPGMILPIRDNETDYGTPNHSGDMFICADGTAYIDTPEDYMTDITLPSAAAPGMWAVKLRLCS